MPSLLTASASRFTSKAAPLLVPLYDQRVGPWQIAGDGTFVCGSAADAQICIQHSGLRDQHCRFEFREGRLTVFRMAGQVWVNEVPVFHDLPLEPEDVVSLGSLTVRIQSGDPLRPQVSDDDGIIRRPILLGISSPAVIFTGGSDRRFHQVFPRSPRSASTAASDGTAQPDVQGDAIRVRQLRERESEVALRESRLQSDETRLAELLEELEQARADLQLEQQLVSRQSSDRLLLEQRQRLADSRLAEASAIQNEALALQQKLQRERQELDAQAAQLQQLRDSLTQQAARQQAAISEAEARLAEQRQQLDQQRDTFAQQQQQAEQQRLQLAAQQQQVVQQLAQLELQKDHRDQQLAQQAAALEEQSIQLQQAQAIAASDRDQLAGRLQALEVREAALAERSRKVHAAALTNATLDNAQIQQWSDLEARAAELAARETELAGRVADVCRWRRQQAARLLQQRVEMDAAAVELRQQKSALRLKTRELEALENSLNQKLTEISHKATADFPEHPEHSARQAELEAELEAARVQQQLITQQLTAALTTCEKYHSTQNSLLAAQDALCQRDRQMQDLQLQLSSAVGSVAERDTLIQELHRQLLNLLNERRSDPVVTSPDVSQPTHAAQSVDTAEMTEPAPVQEAAVQEATVQEATVSVSQHMEQPAQVPEQLIAAETVLEAAGSESLQAHNQSLLHILPPGVLHNELFALLQLSHPDRFDAALNIATSRASDETENLSSSNIVPVLDDQTARMLQESSPEVRAHIEKLLFDRRRTEDEAPEMPAPKSTASPRRPSTRSGTQPEKSEPISPMRPAKSYIDEYNRGAFVIGDERAAFEVAAEAEAAAVAAGSQPAAAAAQSAPAAAEVAPRSLADEMVRSTRRTNTNVALNQHLNELRKIASEASQTAIIRHSLRRHRKGFLVRTSAMVASMAAVVWSPPWLLLWTQNRDFAFWGPLALLTLTCLELTRKLVLVLRLERRKIVAPIAPVRPAMPLTNVPPRLPEPDGELDDQHPLI